MKTGILLLVTLLVLAAGGYWIGLPYWDMRHGLVTLHVKDVPLTEVARMIEAQIHQKIRVDQKLDTKVTLNVRRKPLASVLDSLAELAGARWRETFAVYDSDSALSGLESVLAGSSKLDAEGWTNIAPHFDNPEMPNLAAMTGGNGSPRIVLNGGGGGGSGHAITFTNEADAKKFMDEHMKGAVIATDDVTAGPGNGGGADGHAEKRVMMRMKRGPNGVTTTTTTMDGDGEHVSVTKSGLDGKVVERDDWSRERLVLEIPLVDRLGDATPEKATVETAAATAAKTHSKLMTYYGFEKPPLGGDFRSRKGVVMLSGKGGTNNPQAVMDALRKENALGGMGNLTPEEQVQRARQQQAEKDGVK